MQVRGGDPLQRGRRAREPAEVRLRGGIDQLALLVADPEGEPVLARDCAGQGRGKVGRVVPVVDDHPLGGIHQRPQLLDILLGEVTVDGMHDDRVQHDQAGSERQRDEQVDPGGQ